MVWWKLEIENKRGQLLEGEKKQQEDRQVVQAVVADVGHKGSRDDSVGHWARKDLVGESGERQFEGEEEHGRHDQSHAVLGKRGPSAKDRRHRERVTHHREEVMDPVHEEVEEEEDLLVGHLGVQMKHAAMEEVLQPTKTKDCRQSSCLTDLEKFLTHRVLEMDEVSVSSGVLSRKGKGKRDEPKKDSHNPANPRPSDPLQGRKRRK